MRSPPPVPTSPHWGLAVTGVSGGMAVGPILFPLYPVVRGGRGGVRRAALPARRVRPSGTVALELAGGEHNAPPPLVG